MKAYEPAKLVIVYCCETNLPDGLSVDSQRKIAGDFARQQGLSVIREFVGRVSDVGQVSADEEKAGSFAAAAGCALIHAPETVHGGAIVFEPLAVAQLYG